MEAGGSQPGEGRAVLASGNERVRFSGFPSTLPMWSFVTRVTQTLQMSVGQACLPETMCADGRPFISTTDLAGRLQVIHVGYDHAC